MKEITTAAPEAPKPVELTPSQRRDWEMTRAALSWQAPAFTHIFYTMMADDREDVALFTKDIPIAATDGATMILNPETFFQHPLKERVFILAHEILHCVFDHCGMLQKFVTSGSVPTPKGGKLPYDHQTCNVAMDLVINAILVDSNVGAFPKQGLLDKKLGAANDDFITVYERVYKANQGGKGMSGGFDQHLQPGAGTGQNPTQAAQARNATEWDTAVAAAAASAKVAGKLPAALERFFTTVLEPKVAWQEKIQSFFARKVGSGSYDWRRADRRLIVRDIYAPGRSGFGAGVVVCAIDTSGSIGQQELDTFFAEMRNILEDVRPRAMHIVWCDAKVHKVDEVSEANDLHGLKPHGGGDTDFVPVFDWIAGNNLSPDALVYLTDGHGRFPGKEPSYPVLWGDITNRAEMYPWGEVVHVEL